MRIAWLIVVVTACAWATDESPSELKPQNAATSTWLTASRFLHVDPENAIALYFPGQFGKACPGDEFSDMQAKAVYLIDLKKKQVSKLLDLPAPLTQSPRRAMLTPDRKTLLLDQQSWDATMPNGRASNSLIPGTTKLKTTWIRQAIYALPLQGESASPEPLKLTGAGDYYDWIFDPRNNWVWTLAAEGGKRGVMALDLIGKRTVSRLTVELKRLVDVRSGGGEFRWYSNTQPALCAGDNVIDINAHLVEQFAPGGGAPTVIFGPPGAKKNWGTDAPEIPGQLGANEMAELKTVACSSDRKTLIGALTISRVGVGGVVAFNRTEIWLRDELNGNWRKAGTCPALWLGDGLGRTALCATDDGKGAWIVTARDNSQQAYIGKFDFETGKVKNYWTAAEIEKLCPIVKK